MSVDTRPIYRLTLDRYLDRPSTDMSIDTRPICWSISAASRPTCMSVDTRSLSQRRSTDTQPIPYWHLVGSQRSFLYLNCYRLLCPPHRPTYAFSQQDHVYFRHGRSRIDRHYRMTLGRNLGSVLSDTTGRHSANISVEYWPTISADTRPILDRHPSRHL